jgi:hypothetical protein
MGARGLPIASVFVFGFSLTTGCGLSRGTPVRSFQHTIPANQTALAENGFKQPNAYSEKAKANILSLDEGALAAETLEEPSVLSSDTGSRENRPRHKPMSILSRMESKARPRTSKRIGDYFPTGAAVTSG